MRMKAIRLRLDGLVSRQSLPILLQQLHVMQSSKSAPKQLQRGSKSAE
jgi:hypothetical protein